MATSLLALIDDIASVLDDIAVMTKVAAKKTSGVIGDDLALNAEQLNGISSDKEIPIIWAVAKGGLKNKAILIPLALLISAFAKWLVVPMLMIGGLYLCFEGVEKVIEKLFHKEVIKTEEVVSLDDKIKGAIRTDFILSAEIIIIALGSVAQASILVQVISLLIIGLTMNIGVYGLVALIVKLDDLGLLLLKTKYWLVQKTGSGLVKTAPVLMKILAIVGTIAMFLVGGGIIAHGLPFIAHNVEPLIKQITNPALMNITLLLSELTIGVLSGLAVVAVIKMIKKIKG